MVVNGKDGILFPANAPYTAASLIKKVTSDRVLAENLSKEAMTIAARRHNRKEIGERLYNIYTKIITNKT